MNKAFQLGSERWSALWHALGAAPPAGSFERLIEHYAEPHRHYHTAEHIAACLGHFQRFGHLAAQPALVELALWTHDLIYDTRARDNEAQSAAVAVGWLRDAGLEPLGQPLSALIMATTHTAAASDDDAGLVVDLDLAVLAQEPDVYQAYSEAVRQEFAWVPLPAFRAGRGQVLRGLLALPNLYGHPAIAEHWEERARFNLTRELESLVAS